MTPARSPTAPPKSASALEKATYVRQVVAITGNPPFGYVGGRVFNNDGRSGTALLPRADTGGHQVGYREYDINPKRAGVNRGPQRLVLGTDSSAWVTLDHYRSWQRLPEA